MSLETLLDTPCTILRRPSVSDEEDHDEYGEPLPGVPTEIATYCELQQTQRSEPVGEGEFSRSTWTVWFPEGVELDTGDAVEVDGYSYEVVGAPWQAAKGGIAFTEATLVRGRRLEGS